MVTFLVYLMIDIVFVLFAYKLFFLVKKKDAPISSYFFGAIIFYTLGQTTALVLIGLFLFSQQGFLLYWTDVIGRLTLLLGGAFVIQVPLYVYFPKSKKRFITSYLIAAVALAAFIYNLTLRYQPFIDSTGIIQWETPISLAAILGPILLLVWLLTAVIFLLQFIKSKFESKKSLMLALGFFLATLGTVLQDFGRSTVQYILINLLLAAGFILILLGLLIDEKSNK